MKRVFVVFVGALLWSGCARRYVDMTVRNGSAATLNTVEVDYPGGSFGRSRIDPGQEFHYRFKSLHDGMVKISFGDGAGHVLAVGERDCSVQRRNQKVIEEAPAPDLSDSVRVRLHQTAVDIMRSIHYRSAGTVEFLHDAEPVADGHSVDA